MQANILIADDEKEIADLLEIYLKNDGYTVFKFYTGMEALACVEREKIDLALLDVMLPDIDGFHICAKIREKYFFPIIMLTARVEDGDKIQGLTVGADDYITKPFNPLEVTARVKTQLRRWLQYNPAPAGAGAGQKETDEIDIRGLVITIIDSIEEGIGIVCGYGECSRFRHCLTGSKENDDQGHGNKLHMSLYAPCPGLCQISDFDFTILERRPYERASSAVIQQSLSVSFATSSAVFPTASAMTLSSLWRSASI